MRSPFFTVFTPTYNRLNTLPRLYESLCKQKFVEFEWLIVDDGSADETESYITQLIAESKIAIRYYKQQNQGKHVAINTGVGHAYGFAFLIIDSDDWLSDDALNVFYQTWNGIDETKRNEFSGVGALCAYENGIVIGDSFKHELIDEHPIKYMRTNFISGDKCGFHLTSILKKNPFPVFTNEKMLTESIVWNAISHQYKMRLINQVLSLKEYLDGGLTSKFLWHRVNSCRGTIATYKSEIDYCNFGFISLSKGIINYVRFSLHGKQSFFIERQWYKNLLMLVWFPFSYLLFRRDLFILSKK
jgi:glycosyltransferase involved in cell wall biosynthesis